MKKCLCHILILMMMTGLCGCADVQQDIPDLLEPVGVQVDTAVVVKGDMSEVNVIEADVVPYVEGLYFTEGGYVDEVHVTVGDVVSKGQVLVSLDEEKLDEQIASLEKDIVTTKKLGELSDQKAAADIKATGIELEMMWKTGEVFEWQSGPSLIDYNIKYVEKQKKELTLEQTQELRQLELQEKQRQLKLLKEKKGKNKLVAPFDGRVVYVAEFDVAGTVREYNTIVCVADESRLSLVSEMISETEIKRADKIYAHIMDKDYAITHQPYTAEKYVEMALAGEEIPTIFTFDAEEEGLESGQYASILMHFNCREDVLIIPANALYKDANGQCVYLMENGKRIRQGVKVGAASAVSVEILEGVKEGDVVYVKD